MSKSNESTDSGKRPGKIHDHFFKDVFAKAEDAISLIEAGAPKELFKIVEWSTLKMESPAIRADGHTERHADLMLSARLRDCKQKVRIILLFEHKSYSDSKLVKQLARNQFLKYIETDFESLVVPIVVSQEPSPDRPLARFINLFQKKVPPCCLKVLSKYAVNFQCVL